MGNIQGLFSPLSKQWLESQADLQRNIVQRMRSFGILTILPAFSGHVPRALSRVYPNASISTLTTWSHFDNVTSA